MRFLELLPSKGSNGIQTWREEFDYLNFRSCKESTEMPWSMAHSVFI